MNQTGSMYHTKILSFIKSYLKPLVSPWQQTGVASNFNSTLGGLVRNVPLKPIFCVLTSYLIIIFGVISTVSKITSFSVRIFIVQIELLFLSIFQVFSLFLPSVMNLILMKYKWKLRLNRRPVLIYAIYIPLQALNRRSAFCYWIVLEVMNKVENTPCQFSCLF